MDLSTPDFDRERLRVAIANTYRAYCEALRSTSKNAAKRRSSTLRALKRWTREADDQKALEAGREATIIRRQPRSLTLPDGTLPAAGIRAHEFHGRGPQGVHSVVVNNVGRGKRQ